MLQVVSQHGLAPVFTENQARIVVHKHIIYIDLNLKVLVKPDVKGLTPFKHLRNCVILWFTGMQDDVDNTLCLLSYLPTDPEEKNAIHHKKLNDLPTSLSKFRNYVNGARTDKKEFTAFLRCRIGFDGDKDQVISDLDECSEEARVFKTPLQADNVITPCWLNPTCRNSDRDWMTTSTFNQLTDLAHEGKTTVPGYMRPIKIGLPI